jgi:predicted DNA-binding transcriptional regulator YafY
MVDPLVRAVIDGRLIEVDYDSARRAKGRRVLHPLGLVAKRGTWYLLAIPDTDTDTDTADDTETDDDGVRAYRVDRVRSFVELDAAAVRPPGFDLDVAWDRISARVETLRAGIEVRAWVRHDLIGVVRWQFGAQCTPIDDLPDRPGPPDRWFAVRLTEGGVGSMAGMLAGFGAAVSLVDPPQALVDELSRIGAELAAAYGPPRTSESGAGDPLVIDDGTAN